MKICISKESIENNKLSLEETIYLLLLQNNIKDISESEKSLIEKGLITQSYDELFNTCRYRLTNKAKDILNNIILESDKEVPKENDLMELALKLKEIYPKGKKPGTNYYWAEGTSLIIKRLQLFIKKYGSFKHEDIIKATEKYVKGFNGIYQYMQLLKYFIFKEKVGASGEIESQSELINYIENDTETPQKENWTSTLK